MLQRKLFDGIFSIVKTLQRITDIKKTPKSLIWGAFKEDKMAHGPSSPPTTMIKIRIGHECFDCRDLLRAKSFE
jgi:hypothetical protein